MPEKNNNLEFLLAYMLEPIEKGDQFISWPLHVTLMPWFRTHLKEVQIMDDIKASVGHFKPVAAKGIQRTKFGLHGTVPVTALASLGLHDLHRSILDRLKAGSYQFNEHKFINENYLPHVTKKGSAEFKPGHSFLIDRVYLVKAPIANPRTRTKTVVGMVELQ